jgi:GntR family transcriptional repressor for pyruvate dehydrogenase complex
MKRSERRPDDDILAELREMLSRLEPDSAGRVRLPTERQLAESLGVQRTTVRERLAALETIGLIRRTQGSGTFLAVPQAGFLQFYFETALRVGHFTQAEVQEAREVLEREIARLAALSATQDDIAALGEALAAMAGNEHPDGRVAADMDFHLALARAAHNPVIDLIVEGLSLVLRQALRQRIYRIHALAGMAARVTAAHRAVLEAVQERDPDQAAEAMDEHFAVWKRESSKVSNLSPEEGMY